MNNSQKYQFLDSLKPDDFRNPASFNQIDHIIDNILQGYGNAKDKEAFVHQAVDNLFRQDSTAKENLTRLILET